MCIYDLRRAILVLNRLRPHQNGPYQLLSILKRFLLYLDFLSFPLCVSCNNSKSRTKIVPCLLDMFILYLMEEKGGGGL